MTNFLTRIRLVYLPFLLATVLFVLVYSFLDWLFLLQLGVPLNEELVHYWLPLLLPWIVIFLWLGPGLKVLAIKDKEDKLPFLYRLVLGFAIAVPTIIAQEYISTATGSLTALNTVNQIDSKQHSRYYTFDRYFVDKTRCLFYQKAVTSGRSNETLIFYTYCACPILKDGGVNGAFASPPAAWLCFKFSKSVSNNKSEVAKDEDYKQFQSDWADEFKLKDVSSFTYFDRIGHNDNRLGYLKAVEQDKYAGAHPVILEGSTRPFNDRNGKSLMWVFLSFGIGAAVWFLMIIIPRLKIDEVEKLAHPPPGAVTDAQLMWLRVLRSSVTVWLIILNLAVFVIMVFAGLGVESFSQDDLVKWGAGYGPLISNGQWWRLLTSIFVHGGLIHIFSNMVSLFFAGLFLEQALGKIRYIAAYLICGLAASMVSLLYHPHSVSAGASGAIMGLFGVLLVLTVTKGPDEVLDKMRLRISLVFIGLNLLFGLTGNVDNAAHIGGLLCGMILGLLFRQFAQIVLIPQRPVFAKSSQKKLKPGI